MTVTYYFKSPIYITEEEYQYNQGTMDEYYLHERNDWDSEQAARKLVEAVNETDSELQPYIDEGALKGKVISMKISVENRITKATVIAKSELTEDEIEDIKDELTGQYSDGWGEGFDEIDRKDIQITIYDYDYDDEEEEEKEVEEEVDTTVDVCAHFYHKDNFRIVVEKEGEETENPFVVAPVKPRLKLVGEDGNIFFITGRATRELRRLGMSKEAEELKEKVTKSKSYHQALGVVTDYFQVY